MLTVNGDTVTHDGGRQSQSIVAPHLRSNHLPFVPTVLLSVDHQGLARCQFGRQQTTRLEIYSGEVTC
jgi:hypothetical protein